MSDHSRETNDPNHALFTQIQYFEQALSLAGQLYVEMGSSEPDEQHVGTIFQELIVTADKYAENPKCIKCKLSLKDSDGRRVILRMQMTTEDTVSDDHWRIDYGSDK